MKSWCHAVLSPCVLAVFLGGGAQAAAPVAVARPVADFPLTTGAVSSGAEVARLELAPEAKIEADGVRLRPRAASGQPGSRLIFAAGQFPAGAFVIELRVKLAPTTTSVLARDLYFLSSSSCFFRYSVDRFQVEFGVLTDQGWVGVSAPREKFAMPVGQWIRLTGVWDGTEVRFLVDGQEMGRTACRGTLAGAPVFNLGALGWGDDPAVDLDGWLAGLKVWSYGAWAGGQAAAPPAAGPPAEQPGTVAAAATSTPVAGAAGQPANAKTPFDPLKPSVVIPKTAVAPPMAGVPAGGAWETAAWVGNAVYNGDKRITDKLGLRVGLLWDDAALYVGFEVRQARPPETVSTTQGDDGLERDDAVEVTLWAPGLLSETKGAPVQFKVNCKGLRDDAIGFDFGWNVAWQSAAKVAGNSWTATLRIPFASLGGAPRPGDRWGGNFSAFLVGEKYRGFTWSPVAEQHHHHGEYGCLEFGGAATPVTRLGPITQDRRTLTFTATALAPGLEWRVLAVPAAGGDEQAATRGNVVVNFEDALARRAAAQQRGALTPGQTATLTLDGLRPGAYLAVAQLLAGTRVVNQDVKPVVVHNPLDVRILPYPVARSVGIETAVHERLAVGAGKVRVTVTLRDAAGAVVRTATHQLNGAAPLPQEWYVKLDGLANGATYAVRVEAGPEGRPPSLREEQTFRLAPRPVWADTRAGLAPAGQVPKPWTPVVKRGDDTLACWGRDYRFGRDGLPVAIRSQGRELLAGPVRIVTGGARAKNALKESDRTAPATVKVVDGGVAGEVAGRRDDAVLRCDVRNRLEYDGFLMLDLEVAPVGGPVGEAVLEIPLTAAVARFLTPMPGALNRDQTGILPKGRTTLPPGNQFWFTDGNVGLFACLESTEGWGDGDKQFGEVVKDGTQTLFRLWLAKGANLLRTPRHYQLFLQAAPLRPRNPDWYSRGAWVLNGLNWGMNEQPFGDDTVERLDAAALAAAPSGRLELTVRNRADLAALLAPANEQFRGMSLLALGEEGKPGLALAVARDAGGICLVTPWGRLGVSGNAAWKPGETHRLTLEWGDTLRFLVDGKPQGAAAVKGLPLGPKPVLRLGSVSARFDLLGLEGYAGGRRVLERPGTLDLRSTVRTPLHVAKELGFKTLIFFEQWNNWESGGRSDYEPSMKLMVEDCHRLGLEVILYFGFQTPLEMPETKECLEECRAMVRETPSYYAPQRQYAHLNSYGGPNQEYLLFHMDRLKREMGINGVYLDGTLGLGGSDNPAFGCGYLGPDGKRRPTVPIRRIRAFAQRINQLFVQDGGTVFAHLGACPTAGYATNTYLGEHVGFLSGSGPFPPVYDFIPPEATLSAYTGYNIGVPAVLCQQLMWPHLRGTRTGWYAASSAWGDVNRVGLNMLLEEPMAAEALTQVKTLRLLKAFDADRCVWLPWWDARPGERSSDARIQVSVFRRPDGAFLAAAANLSLAPVRATVAVAGLAGPGAPLPRGLRNAETGAAIAVEASGNVTLEFAPNQRYWLESVGVSANGTAGK